MLCVIVDFTIKKHYLSTKYDINNYFMESKMMRTVIISLTCVVMFVCAACSPEKTVLFQAYNSNEALPHPEINIVNL